MGTGLEQLGLSEWEAWTAGYRLDDQEIAAKVLQVHLDFLRAGVDVLTANTYKISGTFIRDVLKMAKPANEHYGIPKHMTDRITDPDAFAALCARQNITLARTAVNQFKEERPSGIPRPLLAASMGCYSTCIPGRGETANRDSDNPHRIPGYGVGQTMLEEFHRRRVKAVLDTELHRHDKTDVSTDPAVDILAFETIPDLAEAKAIVNVMEEIAGNSGSLSNVDAWVTFTCPDQYSVDNGDDFATCVEAVSQSNVFTGVGINCTAPHFVVPLLRTAKGVISKTGRNRIDAGNYDRQTMLVCYPNSGERYFARALKNDEAEHWQHADYCEEECFTDMAMKWHAEGCAVIGGCCRITAENIKPVSEKFPLI
jgi:homocysteine S-methyltransferase